MRNQSTPLKWQLSSAGNRSPTVTPGATIQSQIFNLQGLPGRVEDMYAMANALVVEVDFDIDQPSAGATALTGTDILYKAVDSVRLRSEILGELYPLQHTRGPVLGNIIQVLGGCYRYPQPANRQIPTTDQDNFRTLIYRMPFALEFMRKPHHHSLWMPLLEGGELEVRIAASTVFDAQSTGAVTESFTIRAWLEYMPSPEALIHRPFQFREYITPGNSTQHILRNVGGQSGLRGVKSGCRLAFLGNLGDRASVGLSGSDGPDNITRVEIPWRGQTSIDVPESEFQQLLTAIRHRVQPGRVGTGAANVEETNWPYETGQTPDPTTARAALNGAGAFFQPHVFPGVDCELTKLQKIQGDLVMNYGYTTTPSGSSRFVTLEILDYTDEMKEELMKLMGKDPATHGLMKKTINKQDPRGVNPSKLDALPDKILRHTEDDAR